MWLFSIQHAGYNTNYVKYIKNCTQLLAKFKASVIDMKCALVIEETGGYFNLQCCSPKDLHSEKRARPL